MRKLQDTKTIWHSLIWVAIYIVVVNIGDSLGELFNFAELTRIALIALSGLFLIYMRGRLGILKPFCLAYCPDQHP